MNARRLFSVVVVSVLLLSIVTDPVNWNSDPPPALAATFHGKGLWISPERLATLPTSGPAWDRLVQVADGALGAPNVADQNSNHDVNTLAVALVAARLGDAQRRAKAANAILSAIGTEKGGRTLALGRNLPAYVIAADLIDLTDYDIFKDHEFRGWIRYAIHEPLDGETLVATHERRPNNWGTHAGAARIVVDLYNNDTTDLARAISVFKGWLGDRSSYVGFKFGDLSWQVNPKAPVGVNPLGATKQGHSIDGSLPDDMRRGCSFRWPPCRTNYPWGALQGVVVQAALLQNAGYDSFSWNDRAVCRAAGFLRRLDVEVGGWWASGDDRWQPWIINYYCQSSYPVVSPISVGKNMGWTDWTHRR